jgi:hypothetical protein
VNDERSPDEAILEGTKGSVEIVEVDFRSSLAAIRFFLFLSLTQKPMLIPENRDIKQTEKTIAVMFPLRFHSASSALAELVAETELVVVVDVLVVVELLLVDTNVVAEVVEVVEVDDVVEVDEVEVEVVVVSEEVVVVEVVVLVVVELVLVVVSVVDSVDVVSLTRRAT